MNATRTCPECGKPVAPNGLQGLCPECMLKVGLAAQTGEARPGGTQIAKPPPPPPPPPAEVVRLFPQLEILDCLGFGGMGAVYKARQPRLDRLVALKILTRDRRDETRDARFAERFEREARALAKLNHPNIVTMYEFGQVEGLPYFIMEYVDGLNLRQLEQAGRLAPREALQIIPQICEALQFAHDEGVVHRDIKPENILLDKKGRVKIADFGIAKILGAQTTASRLTEGLQVIGTPHYMAPEQVEKPHTVDHRADIYSLGVVFYEMLTGELPLGKFAPPSRMVQVDVRLDEVVLHALEKEPERRYQQASRVKTDLETIASTPAAATASAAAEHAIPPTPAGAGSFTLRTFPGLLPGERILHVERRVWRLSAKSLPSYRLFFSLPPLWEAGLYVTDRRLLLVAHCLWLLNQEISVWFPGKILPGKGEILTGISAGSSPVFGDFLEVKSEAPQKKWYRSPAARLRLYLPHPEKLRQVIAAAGANEAPMDAGAQAARLGVPPRGQARMALS